MKFIIRKIRQWLKWPKHKGSLPCFRCGTQAFLYRGFCEFCEPDAHERLWNEIKNAPPVESFY